MSSKFSALLLGEGAVLGLRDARTHLELGGLLATDAVQVTAVVADVLNLQRVEHDAEATQVFTGFHEQALCELHAVLVHLFGRQGREHATEIALEGLAGYRHDFKALFAEESLDRVADDRLDARDLHVGYALDGERDAALRVRALCTNVDDHVGHVEPVDALEEREHERASTLHELVADLLVPDPTASATDDEHLVGLAQTDEAAQYRDGTEHHHECNQ